MFVGAVTGRAASSVGAACEVARRSRSQHSNAAPRSWLVDDEDSTDMPSLRDWKNRNKPKLSTETNSKRNAVNWGRLIRNPGNKELRRNADAKQEITWTCASRNTTTSKEQRTQKRKPETLWYSGRRNAQQPQWHSQGAQLPTKGDQQLTAY